MIFSDDDLKRLKEGKLPIQAGQKFAALLARLEAAEKALNRAERHHNAFHCVFDEHYKAWRKACGR